MRDDQSRVISVVSFQEWLDHERANLPVGNSPERVERIMALRGRLAERALSIMLAADQRVISRWEASELIGLLQMHLEPSDWVRIPCWVSRLAPWGDPAACYAFLMEWLEMERAGDLCRMEFDELDWETREQR